MNETDLHVGYETQSISVNVSNQLYLPEVNLKGEYYKEHGIKQATEKAKCREQNATKTQKTKCRKRNANETQKSKCCERNSTETQNEKCRDSKATY